MVNALLEFTKFPAAFHLNCSVTVSHIESPQWCPLSISLTDSMHFISKGDVRVPIIFKQAHDAIIMSGVFNVLYHLDYVSLHCILIINIMCCLLLKDFHSVDSGQQYCGWIRTSWFSTVSKLTSPVSLLLCLITGFSYEIWPLLRFRNIPFHWFDLWSQSVTPDYIFYATSAN